MPRERMLASTGTDVLRWAEALLRSDPSVLPSSAVLRAIHQHRPLQSAICASLRLHVTHVLGGVEPLLQRPLADRFPPWRRESLTLDEIERRAFEEARVLGSSLVGPDHLMLAVLSMHRDPTAVALRANGVTQDAAYRAYDGFYERSSSYTASEDNGHQQGGDWPSAPLV